MKGIKNRGSQIHRDRSKYNRSSETSDIKSEIKDVVLEGIRQFPDMRDLIDNIEATIDGAKDSDLAIWKDKIDKDKSV